MNINFTEILRSLIAICVVLLSFLAVIVTLIETPSAILVVLIYAIFTTAIIIVGGDENE